MLQLPIAQLVASSHRLTSLSQKVTDAVAQNAGITLPETVHAVMRDCAIELCNCCRRIGLVVTARLSADVLGLLDLGNSSYETASVSFSAQQCISLKNGLMCLSACLERESETKRAMVLEEGHALLFEPSEPHLPEAIANKFPSATFEINEAAKCLALGRETAAVFHLMRLAELGLKAIYKCLNIPEIPRRSSSWGTLINRINQELTSRGGDRWPKHDYFQSLSVQLNAIRHAQRNDTMHVATTYNYEEGRLIFDNTKVLMARIASEMDQDGQPLA